MTSFSGKHCNMKRIFITGIAVCLIQSSFAQDVFDALRYSYQTSAGSARLLASGGTNISLGGDISSAFINPAGLGQFKTNEIVFTPAFNFNTTKTDYNDLTTKAPKVNLPAVQAALFSVLVTASEAAM
jgi:hypothetical protein